jgi:hypothetical protein
VRVDEDVPDLAAVTGACVQAAVDDETTTDAGADGDHEARLGESGRACVDDGGADVCGSQIDADARCVV